MTLAVVGARAVCPRRESPRVDIVEAATILVEGDQVLSVRANGAVLAGAQIIDAGGRLVTPGLIDCHTHAHFMGDRAAEFCARAAGASYLDLAKAGGGIRATVAATRAGSSQARVAHLRERLRRLVHAGVTTVEVKSGYGLSGETEIRFLEEIGSVTDGDLPRVLPTLMAAHAIPPEVDSPSSRERWLRTICETLMPQVASRKLANRIDVFVEQSAYTPLEARTLAAAARQHGLALHLHVDQLTEGGGAALAAELQAQAASHLERVSDSGIGALHAAGVVAILLPTATLCAGEPAYAPARRLLAAGVPVALATNLNPGTAPTESVALLLMLAALGLRMTPEEIVWSVTRGGALALGLSGGGLLDPGSAADLVIWNATDAAHLPYHAGVNHVRMVFRNGKMIVDRTREADQSCLGAL
jgi:imidazolonepropionase